MSTTFQPIDELCINMIRTLVSLAERNHSLWTE